MNVLIACEESQRVCMEFRKRGHNAYSADIQEPSGGYPDYHMLGDIIPYLNGGLFKTMTGRNEYIDKWDLIIAFPPCTYLTLVATRSHSLKCSNLDRINERTLKRIQAEEFFMEFATADCDKIAIENPVGVMNTVYRKPDQIISPYMFAESENDTENYVTKNTCLWLKGLRPLETNSLPPPDNKKLFGVYPSGKNKTWEESITHNRSVLRSKTFPGIAKAMAEQWG